ncbi:radical SAM protein [bacterium]|nr:radical SAM protein [bacterium]
MDIPRLLIANLSGEIIDCPELAWQGVAGPDFSLPENWIPLPPGSEIFTLPGRLPVGLDETNGEVTVLENYCDEPVQAVAAFIAPGYTSLMRPAFERTPGAPILPLYCYTAVGWLNDQFVVPAVRIDKDKRQDCKTFNEKKILQGAARIKKVYKNNRLAQHLMDNCCLTYRCPAARNYALGRWEMPLPTSRACNSHCLGCISFQPGDHVCASQNRIAFTPTAEEIAQLVLDHFASAEKPIASFGQGCEGEPLTEYKVISESIKIIRERTPYGTINLNTNGGMTKALEKVIDAGLDSVRISLNSARPEYYEAYCHPAFAFDDVMASIKLARERGVFVSLNYFVFPGFTDQLKEYEALKKILAGPGVDLIQWRNLNIDPDWYIETLNIKTDEPALGVLNLMKTIREEFPSVHFGYYNPFLGQEDPGRAKPKTKTK